MLRWLIEPLIRAAVLALIVVWVVGSALFLIYLSLVMSGVPL